MGLEILAIALGICTFAHECARRQIHVYSDNTGSEAAADKGKAASWDHSTLVHSIWLKAAQLHSQLWVSRVPTDENIADLPSREKYQLLWAMGAKHRKPHLDRRFWYPEAWESVSLQRAGMR